MTDTMNDEELPDHPLQALHDQLEERYGADASIADDEEVEDWYTRMQTSGLLHVTSRQELRDVRAVKEMQAAEAAGAMVDIQDDQPAEDAPLAAPRAEHLRALKPEQRLAAYRNENATKTSGTVVPTE